MRYLKTLGMLALIILLPSHSVAQTTDVVDPPKEKIEAKSPFSLPAGVYLSSQAPVAKVVEEKEEFGFVLQAVVIGGKRKVATINNQNFNEGDLIFGKKVLEIKKNQVILHDEEMDEETILTLGSIPFPIWVRNGF